MIIIIGGSGFVGSAYARYLSDLQIDHLILNHSNYEKFIGTECDILINANGNSKKFLATNDPKSEFQDSVASVRNSLIDFKFKKYIFLSSGDVYPDCSKVELTRENMQIDIRQQSTYGFHKYLAELSVQYEAKDWLIIRQGGFVGMGIKKNAVYDVLSGKKLWVHPESEFQFINTDESARLVMDLASQGVSNEIVNITGRGTISVHEIMHLASKSVPFDAAAKPVRYEISTQKASQWLVLPETVTSVKSFLQSKN